MIHDLCILMLTAGVTSLLFKLFKQPVVLGYIVAGMLVGPHVLGDAWISNEESVETWSEIGVLFLLFSLGLEFSIKKLLQVGSTAIIGAGVIVTGMMLAGIATGHFFGMNLINSLFLGGMLCMSSTTIVFKAIDDAGMRSHKFAKVCFGILVVEDLFAVVLMVLLTSIAVKNSFEGKELIMQILKLAGYLLAWFIIGILIVPTFLRQFKTQISDETLTIFSIGLCLGMVLLAMGAGFSSALGAFVIGSVLAETIEAERIEHLVEPMKNIFGSIFFVSVGMMIRPALLLEYWMPITILTLVVVFGQIFFGSLGTLLSGQSLKVSLQTGFSLVQIGEFAFIIAKLGEQLGVTDSSLYPIVVAVSVITTFLTPYIMRLSTPAMNVLYSHVSEETMNFLESNTHVTYESHEIHTYVNRFKRIAYLILSRTPIIRKFFKQFNENLYARENLAESARTIKKDTEATLLALDLHVAEFMISANSRFCGKALKELNIRNLSGVTVVGIVRSGININIPGGDNLIFPGDRIVVAGTDTQMDAFSQLVESSNTAEVVTNYKSITLEQFSVHESSSLVGKSIIEADLRRQARCIIMAIVRSETAEIFTNPDPKTTFEAGDTVIVAGEKESIMAFVNSMD